MLSALHCIRKNQRKSSTKSKYIEMQSTSRNRAQFCIRGLNLQSPEVLRVMKGNAQSKIQPKHKLQSGWQRSTPWCWVEPQTCTISINFLPPSLLISWVNPFPSRFINGTIFFCNALAACCHFSIFIGSFLYQRAKPPQGIVLFINLLGKGLTPRACMGVAGSIWWVPGSTDLINRLAPSTVP